MVSLVWQPIRGSTHGTSTIPIYGHQASLLVLYYAVAAHYNYNHILTSLLLIIHLCIFNAIADAEMESKKKGAAQSAQKIQTQLVEHNF